MWEVVDIDPWPLVDCDSVMNFFAFYFTCAESIEITDLVIYNCHVQPMIDDGHYNIWGICIDR